MQEEYHIQTSVVLWLRANFPNALFTIAPSGMKLPIGVAVKLKRMGYSPGTPDICIFEPRYQYHGLFVELKTKRGVKSDEQIAWNEELNRRGYLSIFCYSFDEAVQRIGDYLK